MKTIQMLVIFILLSSVSLAQEHNMKFEIGPKDFDGNSSVSIKADFAEPLEAYSRPKNMRIFTPYESFEDDIIDVLAKYLSADDYKDLPTDHTTIYPYISLEGKMISVRFHNTLSSEFKESDLDKYKKLYDKIMSITIDKSRIKKYKAYSDEVTEDKCYEVFPIRFYDIRLRKGEIDREYVRNIESFYINRIKKRMEDAKEKNWEK